MLQLQLLSYPLTPAWVGRAALPAEAAAQQIRGQSKNTERRTGKYMLVHCIAWPWCGLTGMQSQLKRFRHVQKASEYSNMRYQKC